MTQVGGHPPAHHDQRGHREGRALEPVVGAGLGLASVPRCDHLGRRGGGRGRGHGHGGCVRRQCQSELRRQAPPMEEREIQSS